ncbi:uncharacterized protein EI90DRAFT_3045426 [Cantharellus anzutake]|uniref:uncharacterized protein n=1 Tax=Cantharellus anzutake TaxID=1750568 RepID=UPI001905F0E5|nr:uncharacterized protein EI90DRAFT_3045426 [Cantharellus anzutake]KAF8336346.1 hypothetical protein EI90DRAFT_3045426 [Cantharellus anzutake]
MHIQNCSTVQMNISPHSNSVSLASERRLPPGWVAPKDRQGSQVRSPRSTEQSNTCLAFRCTSCPSSAAPLRLELRLGSCVTSDAVTYYCIRTSVFFGITSAVEFYRRSLSISLGRWPDDGERKDKVILISPAERCVMLLLLLWGGFFRYFIGREIIRRTRSLTSGRWLDEGVKRGS